VIRSIGSIVASMGLRSGSSSFGGSGGYPGFEAAGSPFQRQYREDEY